MRDIKKISILIVLAAVSLLLVACGGRSQPGTPDPTEVANSVNATLSASAPEAEPTEEPPPTEAPPTDTPEPVIEIPEGDPIAILGEPSGVDNFDNKNNWTLFDSQCFKSEITDGKYQITAKGLKETVCWEVSWPMIDNYYLETLAVMPETCQAADRFGIFFRAPDNNQGYLYGITCDGQFTMTKWDGTQTTEIVPLTTSQAINVGPGQLNRLGLAAYSNTYLLYANGMLVGQAEDASYIQPGKIGYFVRASSEQPFTLAYDYLKVWVLSDAYYPPGSTTPPDTAPLPTPEPGTATVTAVTYVNVRSGPSLNYPIYFVAQPGATGQAVGISSDGQWYAVNLGNSTVGWVAAAYVVPQNTGGLPVIPAPPLPPDVKPPQPPTGSATAVTTEPVNVRSGPGQSFSSYGKIARGTIVQVVNYDAATGWYAIVIPTSVAPDGIGWVSGRYLSFSTSLGTPTPTPPTVQQTPTAPPSGQQTPTTQPTAAQSPTSPPPVENTPTQPPPPQNTPTPTVTPTQSG